MFRIRLVAMLVVSLLLGAVAVPVAAFAQGNSDAADICKKGGYVNYTDDQGNPFKNTGQCVQYAAHGNDLVPVANEDTPSGCENGAWEWLAPAEDATAAFLSEEDCASYVRDVGDPVPYDPPMVEPTGCEDGAWASLAPAEDQMTPFHNQEECDAYVEAGGQAVPYPPVVGEPGEPDRCVYEAQLAGFDPSGMNSVSGTAGNDTFTDADLTSGPDLICGFGGDDYLVTLVSGDIFIGGDGSDRVQTMNGGVFVGGGGVDSVSYLYGGTFYGGAGGDYVGIMYGGTFNGLDDNDWIDYMSGGLFFGGNGNDYVRTLNIAPLDPGGFIGGAGEDYVVDHLRGHFDQNGPEAG